VLRGNGQKVLGGERHFPKANPCRGEPAGGGRVAAERLEGLALGLVRDVAYTRIEDTLALQLNERLRMQSLYRPDPSSYPRYSLQLPKRQLSEWISKCQENTA
jgi:hypothetical protein